MHPLLKIAMAFSALRHRNFRYFISGQFLSLIGTFIQSTAQQWLVYSLTRSPFLLGLLSVFQFGPVILLSLFAGVFIDRFPKRNLLLITQTIFMVQSLVLAFLVWTGTVQYWQIALLAILYGVAQTFDLPTRQSFAIELVGKEDLLNAISMNSTAVNLSKILGPTVAGILIVRLGVKACFLINGLSFIPVIFGLFKINAPSFIRAKTDLNPFMEIRNGLLYIVKTRILFFTSVMMAMVCVFSANTQTIIPVFTNEVLKQGASTYSYLLSAMGAGAFVGALYMASRSKRGINVAIIIGNSIIISAVQIIAYFMKSFYPSAVIIAIIGFLYVTFLNMCNSTLQVSSDNEHRGMVMSIYGLLITGTSPLGNSFAGYVMERGGGAAGFLLCGIMTLVLIVPFLLFWKSRYHAFTR